MHGDARTFVSSDQLTRWLALGELMERMLFIEILAWYVAFNWRLFRGAPSPAKD